MTDVKMPNGDIVRFPNDMPDAQIKSLIASKFPDTASNAQPQPQQPYTGTILPLHKDENGHISLAVPTLVSGMANSVAGAVSAPYRALTGQLQMTDDAGHFTPQAIAEGLNMATIASPASIAARTGLPLAENAGLTIAKKAEQAASTPGNQVIQAAGRLNVTLPTAVASDSASVQQLGKTVANVPLVGQPLRKSARDAISQLDTAAQQTQNALGAGNPAIAGNVAKENITDYAKNVLGDAVKQKYDAVDGLVTQNVTSPLIATTKIATDIAARRQNAALPQSSAVSMISQAMNRDGGLNYQGIKTLRSRVGEMLDNPSLIPADMSQAELKQIYGGLSDDLKGAVEKAGGKPALTAFNDANAYAANVAKEREALNSVLGTKSDEAIFDKIASMAGSTSRADIKTLLQVKKSVSPETWNEIGSAVIAKIGRDQEGNLTPDRFISGYAKLSDFGKSTLFSAETRQSLDDIAKVSGRFKQLNQYANPSGTGQTVMTGALGGAAFVNPLVALKVAVPGYVTAKLLARPATAKAVSDYVKAYELAAKGPTGKTADYLTQNAQRLAGIVAQETGDPSSVPAIVNKLLLQKQAGASQKDGESVGPQESQDKTNDSNGYSPEFWKAYDLGRGI